MRKRFAQTLCTALLTVLAYPAFAQLQRVEVAVEPPEPPEPPEAPEAAAVAQVVDVVTGMFGRTKSFFDFSLVCRIFCDNPK